MADEIIDENRIPVIKGVLNSDGSTVVSIKADDATHSMLAMTGLGGTDLGGNPDPRDTNRKVAFFAVSATDGVTPVAVYCDNNGNLLIRNN